jgi:DNA-binding beta-propeller fold protein YncE
VVDPTSHTLYLATGRGDIDVFDVRSCNARTHTECHAVRSIPLSRAVNGLVLDPATRTLYAAVGSGASGAVAVVDASACSATTIKSCDGAVRTVPVRGSPDAMAVDDSTNTLYVRVTDDSLASTVDVLGTARCNGFDVVACAVLASVPAGQGWTLPAPDGMALDPLTGTLYVTSFSDDRLSLLDASHCNAGDRSGCAAAPVTAAVGTGPIAVTVDPGRGRVFVLSYGDATLRLSGVARCRSGDASGCARGPMLPVDALPDAATLDPSTGTVYVGTSQGKTVVIVDVG